MITNLIRSVTPAKANSKAHQVPKDDDDNKRKHLDNKNLGKEKRITQTTLSYAGAAKQGKNPNDPHDDEMTVDTANTTTHDDDLSSTTPKPNADSPDGNARKRAFSKNSSRSISPKKGPLKPASKPNTRKTLAKNAPLNTKVWLDSPTLTRVQKETDGAPKNLGAKQGDLWMQGYDICAAGFKCCVRQSVKLSTKHRCARCGWCLHKDCGLPIQQSRQQVKDNVFKPTETINAVCLLCIDTFLIKVDKPGSSQEHVSTKYDSLKQSVRFDWGDIKLGQYKGCLANRRKKPPGPQMDANTDQQAKDIAEVLAQETQPPSQEIIEVAGAIKPNTDAIMTDTADPDKSSDEDSSKAMIHNSDDDDNDDDTVIMGNEQEEMTIETEKEKPPAPESEPQYFDVQLNVEAPPPGSKGKVAPKDTLKALSTKLCQWLDSIHEYEPSFKLHTVDPDHETQTILHDTKAHDWTKLSEIKQFFRGAFPKPKGGRLFMRVKASFEGKLSNLMGNIGWVHQQENESIRLASLQCFKSDMLGFLLYSLRHTDPDPLVQTLEHKSNKKLAMRWMRINDGTKYDPNRDTREDPKAIHVECSAEDADEVTEMLRDTYGSKSKNFPLGIKFRFVPTRSKLLDPETIMKYDALMNRQKAWCEQQGGIMREDITAIDAPISGTTITLRQEIMSLAAHTGNSSTPLAFSIDKKWKQQGYNFSFHPDKLEEGRRMVKGLIPILLHKYSEAQIRPFFTPRAFRSGKDLTYDPTTGAVSSRADRDLDLIFDDDDEMSTIIIAPIPSEDTGGAQIFGQRMADTLTKERADDDTISTMRNGDASNNLAARTDILPPAAVPTQSGSVGSGTTTSSLSITTKHTMNSRLSTIETDYGDMKKELVQISGLLKLLTSQSAAAMQPTPTHQNVTHANEVAGQARPVPSNINTSPGPAGFPAGPGPG